MVAMEPPELAKKRQMVIRSQMEQARELMRPVAAMDDKGVRLLQEYRQFLEGCQFELALGKLEELGHLQLAPGGFWRWLEQAAISLNLSDRIPGYREERSKALDRTNESKGKS